MNRRRIKDGFLKKRSKVLTGVPIQKKEFRIKKGKHPFFNGSKDCRSHSLHPHRQHRRETAGKVLHHRQGKRLRAMRASNKFQILS